MKTKKEQQILALVKNPGEEPYIDPRFENTLEAFQQAVGGFIEALYITTDIVLICNEEGRLRGLPYNTTFLGADFYGPVLIVGAHGDEFRSLKSIYVSEMRRLLRGGDRA